MTEDTRAQESVEVQAQQEPMPSSNEQGEKINQQPDSGESQLSDIEDLPEGVSQRTREQFEKLRSQLNEARSQLGEKEQRSGVFDTMRAQGIQPEQVAPTPMSVNDLVDPQGYVDLDKLERVLNEVAEVRTIANSTLETVQEREAYSSYPELNPDPANVAFDAQFQKMTRALLLDSMANPQLYGNRQLSLKQAADEAKKLYARSPEHANQVAESEVTENLVPKETAALEAVGRSDRRKEANQTQEELSYRTRIGDKDALRQRLSRIPIER